MDKKQQTPGQGGQQGGGDSLRPDTRMLLAQVVEKLEDRVEQGPSLASVQRRFPEWELREVVGRGGMASVYKAWDPKLERYLAIKVLDESLAEQPDFAERFAREAKTLVGLQHPNVLRPLDYGEREGLYFIVTEYFAGGNLAQHLKEGQLPADRALSLIREIGGALAYAHEQGLVHRDLKPSNILIDEAGHACLADFGIVHLLGERQETLALTRTQQSLGTPHYVAPEMLHGDAEVDARGDIYALGVTAYEMLTGRLPLGRFEPPSKLTAVGPAVDEAIDRCLCPDPVDRWRSVGASHESWHRSGIRVHVCGLDLARPRAGLAPAAGRQVAAGCSKPRDTWAARVPARIYGWRADSGTGPCAQRASSKRGQAVAVPHDSWPSRCRGGLRCIADTRDGGCLGSLCNRAPRAMGASQVAGQAS